MGALRGALTVGEPKRTLLENMALHSITGMVSSDNTAPIVGAVRVRGDARACPARSSVLADAKRHHKPNRGRHTEPDAVGKTPRSSQPPNPN
jgi:hypothetical protein